MHVGVALKHKNTWTPPALPVIILLIWGMSAHDGENKLSLSWAACPACCPFRTTTWSPKDFVLIRTWYVD